ncbi:MAG: hypothetical protein VX768_19940 [Planctomycetota bacterium]|nr:hypothetical protein [Planctomycetota bacterium]
MESISESLDALNEIGSRGSEDRRQGDTEVSSERRKVQRRRLIDPTTCERDYTNDEIEFMQAMEKYKRRSGRMFPTCSEILEVLREMGYVRLDIPNEEPEPVEIEKEPESSEPSGNGIRTADVISSNLDDYEDFEETFEEDYEDDFEEES